MSKKSRWQKLSWADKRFIILVGVAIVAGLVIRLCGLPRTGTFADLILINSWGRIVNMYGWTEIYRHNMMGLISTNYPPLNVAIFGAVTLVHDLIFGEVALNAPSFNVAMKIPSVLADAWMAMFVFAILRRFVVFRTAVIAGVVCWLLPSYWLISAYWGQTDSIYSSLSLGSLIAAVMSLPFLSGFLLGLSVLTKVQGVIIAPVILIILAQKRKNFFPALLGLLFPCLVVLIPFSFADRMTDLVGIFTDFPHLPHMISLYTYNMWWAFFPVTSSSIPDVILIKGVASFRSVGYALTFMCYAGILWRLLSVLRTNPVQRRVMEASLAAAALSSLSFFLLMTRVHQRHFFPFLVCAFVLLFLRPEGRRHVLILLTTFSINVIIMMFFFEDINVHLRSLGHMLAWINIVVAADLGRRWWQTILHPLPSGKKKLSLKPRYHQLLLFGCTFISRRIRTAWAYRSTRFIVAVLLALLGVWLRVRSLPDEGYFYDLKVISSWGRIISLFGWTDVYRHQLNGLSSANYPPGNLAIMGAVVRIHDALGGSLQPGGTFLNVLLKIPACLADAWLSLIIFAVVRKFTILRTAVLAGLLYWLNPGVWLLSAVWGQTDGIYTALSFAGLAACAIGFPFLAGSMIALSLFMKIQSMILIPVSVVLLLRRPKDIAPFLAGALPVLLLFLPFVFADRFPDIVWVYTKARGLPELVSFNAFNFWWGAFSSWSPFIADTGKILGIASYRMVGYLITAVSYIFILHRLYRALSLTPDARKRLHASLAAGVLCSLVFFFFMTRIQQRYIMVFFPCAIALGLLSPYGRRHLTFLIISFVLNTVLVMFSPTFGITILVHGRIGWVLAWMNLLVAADLAAILWKTVLLPESPTAQGLRSRSKKKYKPD